MRSAQGVPIRDLDADILKAIAIVSVVFIHSALIVPAPINYISWIFLSLRFCVPVFIFLWAFFAEKSILNKENKSEYLLKKFQRLLIPFFFWSLIYFFIIANFDTLTISKVFTTHFVGSGWAGQYYFIILFQLIVVFLPIRFIIHRVKNYYNLIIAFSIVFYIIISYSNLFTYELVGKMGDRPFIYWVPYVILGIICANTGIAKSLNIPLYLLLIVPFIIHFETHLFHPKSISHTPYLLPSVFVSSIILIHSLMGKGITLTSTWLIALIKILSSNTLGIFCLNPLIIISISYLLKIINYKFNFAGHSIITPILSVVLVTSLCVVAIKILKKIKLNVLVSN